MSTKKTNAALAHCTSILKFWHKVEFFIPFDLQRQVLEAKDAEWSVRTFSAAELNSAYPRALWHVKLEPGGKLSGFKVYLGVFDKVELTKVIQKVVHEALTPDEQYDQQERGELEGRTCFARIKVSAQGEPLFEEVSVSTAPWALGRVQCYGLAGLDFDALQAGVETLKDTLKNFRTRREKETSSHLSTEEASVGEQPMTALPLTPNELSALLGIFYDWTVYRPAHNGPNAPLLVIRTKSVQERAKAPAEKAKEPSAKDDATDADEGDDIAVSVLDSESDILNSFYAKDIERVIAALERGETSPVLEAYLTPVTPSARINLYESDGRKRIVAGLQPKRLNAGHWLDRPCQAMSLMH